MLGTIVGDSYLEPLALGGGGVLHCFILTVIVTLIKGPICMTEYSRIQNPFT